MAATTRVINALNDVETGLDGLARCRKYRADAGLLSLGNRQDFSVFTTAEDLNSREAAGDENYADAVSTRVIAGLFIVLLAAVVALAVACIFATYKARAKIASVITKAQLNTPNLE
jgi:phosphotransferase system  glucose/maltose/N-acetylglucosamine-specific IIC component